MPVAKYWNGSAWVSLNGLPVYEQPGQPPEPVPVGSVWVDTDAPAPAVYPKLLDVQHIEGVNNGYMTPYLSGPATTNLTTNAAQSIPLLLTYTPPVDAWWELDMLLGLVNALTNAYGYVEVNLMLNSGNCPAVGGFPARAAGSVLAKLYRMMHAQVQTFEEFCLSKVIPLSAGVQYQVLGTLRAATACSFQYYQAAESLYLQGKAWSR